MQQIWKMLIVIFVIVFVAVGCGSKNADDIVNDLTKQLDGLESYKTDGKLTLNTGETQQEYEMEVWYKQPSYYRIALRSAERNITQIILRNDEGVFVLTPHLNKSFRFQSGWPEKHGQIYLYESLVQSVIDDEERKFETVEGQYVFEVKADYQNRAISRQKVWMEKDLSPVRVELLDVDYKVLVTVDFANFEKNVEFDKDSFDKERNMSAALMTIPAMADGVPDIPNADFGAIHPAYVPEGVNLVTVDQVGSGTDKTVVLKYEGSFHFNLIEQRPQAASVSYTYGEPVDLGSTYGVLTGDQLKSLVWTHEGVEYKLAGDMPDEEMIKVAKSVFGQTGK